MVTAGGWIDDGLWTREDVAAFLNVPSARTVDRLRARGVLRGVKVGRVWRFRPEDVRACVDRLADGSAS